MQRKSIFTILGVMLAVVVTSLALVFTVGPKVSAEQSRQPFLEIADEDDFIIDENGVLSGFTENAYNKLSQCFGKGSSGEFCYDGDNYCEVHVKIPEKVTCIGDGYGNVFRADEGGYDRRFEHLVTEVSLPSNLLAINNYAFANCYNLTSIVIPDKVTDIGHNAFNYCCLGFIKIGKSVISIGDEAFFSAVSFYSIIIPDSVETMGERVFGDCKIKRVYCEATEKPTGWDNNWFDGYSNWYDDEGSHVVDIIFGCNKTVTFNTDGGSVVADQKVCRDHYASKPTDPTRNGFVFQYWYTTDEDTPFDFENEQVTDNMTLTAKWEPVATQNNENQNQENNQNQNNETTNHENANNGKKFNPVMAWIGGGIAAGLSVICGAAIVVAKKRRK